MEKYLFLDIDGVLNDQNYFLENRDEIDPVRVKRLARIIQQTGAKIILSSTWRDLLKTADGRRLYHYLEEKLAEAGLSIYDHTPDLSEERPVEILAYLQDHPTAYWASIEDDYREEHYAPYGMSSHLVKTEFYRENGGLQEQHIPMAVRILNGDSKEYRKSGDHQ